MNVDPSTERPMPTVSVVIPTFSEERAKDTVECLEAQTYPIEVIVAAFHDRTNSGARNVGISRARTELVAFTDDDCFPHPDWVEQMVKHFGPRRIAGVEGETYGGLRRIYPWGYMTCNVMYRLDVLKLVGGFSEDLSGYREDTDIAWRMKNHGFRILYEPNAKVRHPNSPRSGINMDNEVRFAKCHPFRYLWYEGFMKEVYDLMDDEDCRRRLKKNSAKYLSDRLGVRLDYLREALGGGNGAGGTSK